MADIVHEIRQAVREAKVQNVDKGSQHRGHRNGWNDAVDHILKVITRVRNGTYCTACKSIGYEYNQGRGWVTCTACKGRGRVR